MVRGCRGGHSGGIAPPADRVGRVRVTRVGVADETAVLAHIQLASQVLLLLQRRAASATVRRTNAERVLAVRKTDATVPHQPVQRVAVKEVQGPSSERHGFELKRLVSA